MDDAEPVRLLQGIGDLNGSLQQLLERQRTLLEALGEVLPVEVLHDQVVHPVLRADVIEMADVGMRQGGDGPRLALETLFQIGIRREVGGNDLDGNGTVEARIARTVHFSHAAGADGRLNFIRTKSGSRTKRHSRFPRAYVSARGL
jgi:hypothetical protein